jgi:transposase
VFGAVNPENGDLFTQFAPAGDTENFQSFLSSLSKETLGKNVILLEDNATYHHFKGIDEWLLESVDNLSILYFPSHCSDLNSIELLWKHTRTIAICEMVEP